ncbi:MAG: uroporphyrinogen-III C-methyltransferase [Bacteroidota bacterium]
MPSPRFTLVGAGPGDPDLFTLRGMKVLRTADVVLYDALMDRSLLDYAPNATRIFVGKRQGVKAYSQEEIHDLIVKHAFADGHVVRLKGGDPFVFGRGAEEIEYASNFGIPVAVVPGITSSTSVPASLGISVTQRGVAESFWVITGTTSDRVLSQDILKAAQTSATVVVLMGFRKLSQMVLIYQQMGKGSTPIAVIQDGTTTNEQSAVGTIDTIEHEVELKNLGTPAIIVIGDVVRHSNQLKHLFEEVSQQSSLKIA